MPKIKTHKSTAKRFRLTGGGKLVCRHQGRTHLRRNKSPRTLIQYRTIQIVESAGAKRRVKRLAPYLED